MKPTHQHVYYPVIPEEPDMNKEEEKVKFKDKPVCLHAICQPLVDEMHAEIVRLRTALAQRPSPEWCEVGTQSGRCLIGNTAKIKETCEHEAYTSVIMVLTDGTEVKLMQNHTSPVSQYYVRDINR